MRKRDSNTLWRLKLLGSWSFDRLESWFTDMASKGWYLEDFGPFRARFRRAEPTEQPIPARRYRAALQFDGEIEEEEKSIYEECGWHFVSHWNGVNMFCSDDSNAPEFFSDDVSFRKRSRGFFLNLVFWLVLYLFYLWNTFIYGIGKDITTGPLHLLNEPLFPLFLLSLVIVAVFWLFTSYQIIRALYLLRRRHYRHDVPYRKTLHAGNVLMISLVLMLLLSLAVVALDNSSLWHKDPLNWQSPHPVTLAEFNKPLHEEYRKRKDDAVYTQFTDYWGDTRRSILFHDARRIYYAGRSVEHLPFDDTRLSTKYYYAAQYYEARSETIARKYMEEEIRQNDWLNETTDPDSIRIPCAGVDYAGYYQEYEDAEQYLYLRKGSRLEIIVLKTEGKDLRDSLTLFVRDLNEHANGV